MAYTLLYGPKQLEILEDDAPSEESKPKTEPEPEKMEWRHLLPFEIQCIYFLEGGANFIFVFYYENFRTKNSFNVSMVGIFSLSMERLFNAGCAKKRANN